MVKLCQLSSVAPRKLMLQREDIKRRPDSKAVETGASAIVYRAEYKGKDVAIKNFRLHTRTIHRIKKVRSFPWHLLFRIYYGVPGCQKRSGHFMFVATP